MAATYEQAYDTLKKFGWGDDEIKKSLEKEGLKPSKGGGGGGSEEFNPDPEDGSPINGVDMPDEYHDIDIDYTDPNGEEKLGDITKDKVIPEYDDGEAVSGDPLTVANKVSNVSMIVQEAMKAGVAPEALGKWLTSMGGGLGKFGAATVKFGLRNLGAIAAALTSAIQAGTDRKNGVLKAEYGVNGDYSNGAYWRDVGRNLYGYTDNLLFGALPNIDSVYNKGAQDGWYSSIHNNEAQGNQKNELKKNKEIKDTYKKLAGADGFWSGLGSEVDNVLGTSMFEGGYLAEEKNIKKNYGGDGVMMAEQQLSRAANNMGLLNDADFKKEVIDQGYKFGMVKDKKGNKSKAWYKLIVDGDGEPILDKDGKKQWITLTQASRAEREARGKSNEKKK